MTFSACKTRMKRLEKTRSSYDQHNMLLIAHNDYESLKEQPYIKGNHFSQVDEFYIQNMCKFQSYLDADSPNTHTENQFFTK